MNNLAKACAFFYQEHKVEFDDLYPNPVERVDYLVATVLHTQDVSWLTKLYNKQFLDLFPKPSFNLPEYSFAANEYKMFTGLLSSTSATTNVILKGTVT